MDTVFDRWEKDPFFCAAEEVQEAADRMESVFRRWIINQNQPNDGVADLSASELRRELNVALGTSKWQLEELERALRSSDHALSAGQATVTRHRDFIQAISCKIFSVEKRLEDLNREKDGLSAFTWVRLDEGERDELALFLSRPRIEMEKVLPTPSGGFHVEGNRMNVDSSVCFSNLSPSNDSNPLEVKIDNVKDQQRVASASDDLGLLKLSISTDSNPLEVKIDNVKDQQRVASASDDLGLLKLSISTELSPWKPSDQEPNLPLAKILSFSELRTAEAATKPKWYRHGFRKWKALSHDDVEGSLPLRNHNFRGMDALCERSKSCLSDCTDEDYNKQIYGWLGAFLRQIQRSQYQIQYVRRIQIIVWTFVTILLIVLLICELSVR